MRNITRRTRGLGERVAVKSLHVPLQKPRYSASLRVGRTRQMMRPSDSETEGSFESSSRYKSSLGRSVVIVRRAHKDRLSLYT